MKIKKKFIPKYITDQGNHKLTPTTMDGIYAFFSVSTPIQKKVSTRYQSYAEGYFRILKFYWTVHARLNT